MAQYDAIADLYQDSKRLPFRKPIECYTFSTRSATSGG